MRTNDARHALLAGLIDHAPTFPPASLSSAKALAEDARAAASPYSFVLGRLVWRASALAELPSSGREISAVLDMPLAENARVGSVELPPGVELDALPAAPQVYVETALDDDLEDRLDELAELELGAKVRCGGSVVPSDAELARFIHACRDRGLAFKATAGLHHAIRNSEHGFLNLLAAAVFEGEEEAALADTEAAAFSLDAASFSWRGSSAGHEDIARVRRELFHSIGSCSFFEPVEELEALGVLPL